MVVVVFLTLSTTRRVPNCLDDNANLARARPTNTKASSGRTVASKTNRARMEKKGWVPVGISLFSRRNRLPPPPPPLSSLFSRLTLFMCFGTCPSSRIYRLPPPRLFSLLVVCYTKRSNRIFSYLVLFCFLSRLNMCVHVHQRNKKPVSFDADC